MCPYAYLCVYMLFLHVMSPHVSVFNDNLCVIICVRTINMSICVMSLYIMTLNVSKCVMILYVYWL